MELFLLIVGIVRKKEITSSAPVGIARAKSVKFGRESQFMAYVVFHRCGTCGLKVPPNCFSYIKVSYSISRL